MRNLLYAGIDVSVMLALVCLVYLVSIAVSLHTIASPPI